MNSAESRSTHTHCLWALLKSFHFVHAVTLDADLLELGQTSQVEDRVLHKIFLTSHTSHTEIPRATLTVINGLHIQDFPLTLQV